jgi:hypothetical protein
MGCAVTALWTLPPGADAASLCAALEIVWDAAPRAWTLWDTAEPSLVPAGVALWTTPGGERLDARLIDDGRAAVLALRTALKLGAGAWCRAGPTRVRVDALRQGQPLQPLMTLWVHEGARGDGRARVTMWRAQGQGLVGALRVEVSLRRPGVEAHPWRALLRKAGAQRGRLPTAALVDAAGGWCFGSGKVAIDAWASIGAVLRAGLAPVLREVARRAGAADGDAGHVWRALAMDVRALRWLLKAGREDGAAGDALARRLRRLQEVADAQEDGDVDAAQRAVATWHRKGEQAKLQQATSRWLAEPPVDRTPALFGLRRMVFDLAEAIAPPHTGGVTDARSRRRAARRLFRLATWLDAGFAADAATALQAAALAVLEDVEATAGHRGHDREEAAALRALSKAVSAALGGPSRTWAPGPSTASLG